MTIRNATAAEVREHYKGMGDIAHISREGHVLFKRAGTSPWLEGRWVSEYKIDDFDGTIHLS